MIRCLGILACVVWALTACTVQAEETNEVKLRNWYVGWQWYGGERDNWDVFGVDDLPSEPVEERGRGGGFLFGRRFGGRFLLGLQVLMLQHDLGDGTDKLADAEALVVGTVLFRERDTFQPFLRGGFGGSGVILERPDGDGHTVSLGTAVIAGGGLQVRLSSRFSLEWELTSRFSNFLEVNDNPDSEPDTVWKVKTSNMGWRSGLGVMFWF